ncbi:hypothetical protein AXA44_15460 [Rhodococcus sp. SC4]|nr:hypothetical protein AXA44_15460 [Rhodococcus sp. SC4]
MERVHDALRDHGSDITGNGRKAQCPAHDDRHPSLSVSPATQFDGVVVKCQAGCDTDDVLAAIGMTTADLYDNPLHSNGSHSVEIAHYDYTDATGALLFFKIRKEPKTFLIKQANGTWGLKGVDPRPLYRLPEVIAAVKARRPVWLVEGEKDADRLVASLGVCATTNFDGGDKTRTDPLRQENLDSLRGADVRIIADRDDPGKNHARACAGQLTGVAKSVLVYEPAVEDEHADVSDHLNAGHTLAELIRVGGVPCRELEMVRASDIRATHVKYLWKDRIPMRAMTLAPGEEGIGKTTVITRILADITCGTLPGELYGTPRNVIVLAAEDSIDAVVIPRFREAGADMKRVFIIKGGITAGASDDDDPERDDVILPADLALLETKVRETNAVVVNVDSLVTSLPDGLNSIAYKATAKILKQINLWADRVNVVVLAPWHINKGQGTDTAIRMMDSRAFRTAVRSMLLVVPDPDAPEGTTQGIVALDKSNVGDIHIPAMRYRIVKAPYTVLDDDGKEITANCGVAEWAGEVNGDGRAIARRALEQSNEQPGTTKAWLRKYLKDNGRTWREDVVTAAEELGGHSERSISHAAKVLDVIRDEEHGHQDGHPYRHVYWRLR